MAQEITVAREVTVNPQNMTSSTTRARERSFSAPEKISGFTKTYDNVDSIGYKFGNDIQYITLHKNNKPSQRYEIQMNGVDKGFSFYTSEKGASEIASAYTRLSKSGDYIDRDGNEYMHRADYAVERTIKELQISRKAEIEKTFRRYLGLDK